jgi:hypothetical protein
MRGWVVALALGCSGPGPAPTHLIQYTGVSAWNASSVELADLISGTNASGKNPTLVSWRKEFPDVTFVQLLTSANESDLAVWQAAHPGLDVRLVAPTYGVSFDSAAVPFVAYLDPRTFDVLSSEVGFDTSTEQITYWRAWVESH